jgi:hypothetical protein
LQPKDIEALSSHYQDDVWGLMNELEKNSLMAPGSSSPPVGRENLPGHDFFNLIEKLARGGLPLKLKALAILLEKEEPARVFNALAYAVAPHKKTAMADYDLSIKSGQFDYETALLDFAIK